MTKNSSATLINAVLIGCTLLMTGLTVRREFFHKSSGPDTSPRQIEDWPHVLTGGHVLAGDVSKAPVKIVVFSDFQCPFCRKFAKETEPAVERKYGSQVAILYRAWPLANHPYAYPLARAAECAAAQGRFVQFHDAAFSLQDSMQYATIPRMVQIVSANAEIPDTSTFNACAAKRDPVLSIENDKNEAQRIQADGTPTVIINGQQIKIAADSVNVGRMIDQVLANSKR